MKIEEGRGIEDTFIFSNLSFISDFTSCNYVIVQEKFKNHHSTEML